MNFLRQHKRKFLYVLSAVTFALILIAVGAFFFLKTSPAMQEVSVYLRDGENYFFKSDPWLTYRPTQDNGEYKGVIYYPGALIDAKAYAPTCAAVAEAGYTCIIVPMPLNLPFLKPNAVEEVMAAYPDVVLWTIIGHSMGGNTAARFVESHPNTIAGLVLLGSYSEVNISNSGAKVIVIHASEDGKLARETIDQHMNNLPAGSRLQVITGGNHANFAWAGDLSGDKPAKVPRLQQQQIVDEILLEMIRSL